MMDASSLPLPDSLCMHAQYVDGMREIVGYNIQSNTHIARWDTVIEGKQHMYSDEAFAERCPKEEFLDIVRLLAKHYFTAIENKTKEAA